MDKGEAAPLIVRGLVAGLFLPVPKDPYTFQLTVSQKAKAWGWRKTDGIAEEKQRARSTINSSDFHPHPALSVRQPLVTIYWSNATWQVREDETS